MSSKQAPIKESPNKEEVNDPAQQGEIPTPSASPASALPAAQPVALEIVLARWVHLLLVIIQSVKRRKTDLGFLALPEGLVKKECFG